MVKAGFVRALFLGSEHGGPSARAWDLGLASGKGEPGQSSGDSG